MQVAYKQDSKEPPKQLDKRLFWFAEKINSVIDQAKNTHAFEAQFLLALFMAEHGTSIAKSLKEAKSALQD